MRMVVGLGNPGEKYAATRHNIGFQVVERVAGRLRLGGWKRQFEAEVLRAQGAGGPFLLVKPQTFMNLSGQAVAALARYFQVEPADCLVVVDDLDLELGRLRARSEGGHGGHNGLRSLIEHLSSGAFKRIRVGIGRPPPGASATSHVLGRTTAEETEALEQAIEQAVELVLHFVEEARFENWSSP